MNPTYIFQYLYGKRAHLDQLFQNNALIRFRDIADLKNLENEKIRDNELSKEFYLEKDQFKGLRVNNHFIPSSQFAGPLKIGLKPKRCHVLCLSKTPYNDALYARFEADICLKINITFLIQILESNFGKSGCKIVHREVDYTRDFSKLSSIDPENLVFVKNDIFWIEQEYRIALFYPYDDDSVFKTQENRINMFGESKHIEFGMEGGCGMKVIVQEARDIDGHVLYINDDDNIELKMVGDLAESNPI